MFDNIGWPELLVLALVVPTQDITPRTAVAVVIMFGLGFLVLLSSFRRSRLGVAGIQGEQMFVDLRDRILRQGGIPALPPEWYAAAELRSAGGTPFAGDFVVASRVGDRLEVADLDLELVVVAAGRARLVTADMVKPGAVVIDVGMNRIADPTAKSGTRLVGDVDFEDVRRVASLITPVPRGVGPMTIAMLLRNTVTAAQRRARA